MRCLAMRTLSVLIGFSCVAWQAGATCADGPADNLPDNVRPIPPVGIELSRETKQQLVAAADGLAEKVKQVASAKAIDRAEVLVFARAVRMAVESGMFYSEKEVEQARELLKLADARAQQLAAGKKGAELLTSKDAASDAPQLVVGGFRSKIDGSIQPYGLVLPAGADLADKKPRRLDVWLHGRGEKTSEVAFLNQRLRSVGEVAPENTIVLHPYGRYCNAFKFAGEIDVLEAIAHVQKLFAIDEDRIVIRGFSMGGAGCWQMAVHYPGKWMAATPGAGFSETTEFLKAFQQEEFRPTADQSLLLNWYDCPGWSNNLRYLPTIAYSGEIDRQKQAADVMEAAMKQRGLVLNHIIGPQTAHKLHPDSKVEIEKQLAELAKKGRPRVPTEIDFTTYTLRYADDAWLTVQGLERHWHEARVQAQLQPPHQISITTQNVTRLSIDLPADPAVLDRSQPVEIRIDGSSVKVAAASAGNAAFKTTLAKSSSGWQVAKQVTASSEALRKKPGLQGPIDDAFLDAFVFVGPAVTDSGASADSAIDKWVADEMAHAKREWRRHYRGNVVSLSPEEVSQQDIANKNLVLFGTAQSNPLIAKILAKLPLKWQGKELAIGGRTFDANKFVPVLIYPNPLNAERYVVINSGFTFREYAYLNNARQIPMLPDWAIIDATTGRNSQVPGQIAASGFFDEQWKVK